MKRISILAVLFFVLAVSAYAHDVIVLRDGNIIEAVVESLTDTEIKYRPTDVSDGSLFSINKNLVKSIVYEKYGVYVIDTTPDQSANATGPILNPDQLYVSISAEPSGFIAGGPSVSVELTKGHLMASVNANFPTLALNSTTKGFGFGLGTSLNYFWGGRIGGFYLGMYFAWSMYPYMGSFYNPYATYNYLSDSYSGAYETEKATAHNFIIAMNAGYKFILQNGAYFRTGITAGVSISQQTSTGFYYKPDISAGYIF